MEYLPFELEGAFTYLPRFLIPWRARWLGVRRALIMDQLLLHSVYQRPQPYRVTVPSIDVEESAGDLEVVDIKDAFEKQPAHWST
jgi:hypothetical protein